MKNNKLKFLIVVLVFFLQFFFMKYSDTFGIYKSNLSAPIVLTVLDPSATVEVKLNLNYGSEEPTSIFVGYNQPVGTLPTPTRTDYNFLGWYDGIGDNANRIYSDEVITDPVTFYAHWKKIICKKVTADTKLHQETCAQDSGCAGSGLYIENDVITYGTVPQNAGFVAGDAYDCDVDNNGTYDPVDSYNMPDGNKHGKYTERFYFIREIENNGSENTAALVYYTSIDDDGRVGIPPKVRDNIGSESYTDALALLPIAGTSTGLVTWSNPGLVVFDNNANQVARFINYDDMLEACVPQSERSSITTFAGITNYLGNCQFFMETTRFQSESLGRAGIWVQSRVENNTTKYYRIQTKTVKIEAPSGGATSKNMTRPVIEIPISAIEGYKNVERYIINFNTHGGVPQISSMTKYAGETLGTLQEPTLAHNDFAGWYAEDTYDTLVTSTTVVNSNMTLHAKWTPRATNTVTFNANGGTIDGESTFVLTVDTGSTISDDDFPEVIYEGETFDGWYTDSDLTIPFDKTLPITSNIILYAKWEDSAYVAKIGNHPYETLAAAIDAVAENASQATVITILDDITLTEPVIIPNTKSVILDGGIHTIDGNVSLIENRGELEIVGGTWNTAIPSGSVSIVLNKSGSTLTISGGTLTNNSTATNDDSVVENTGGTVHIIGGTLIGNAQAAAINNRSSGIVNVSGGRIIGTNTTKGQAIFIESGTVNISSDAYIENVSVSSGGNARAAVDNNGGTLIITGGTIVSKQYNAVMNRNTNANTTIGSDDTIIDITTPVLRGKKYGLDADKGNASVYDGIFESLDNTTAYKGTISDENKPTGISFVNGTIDVDVDGNTVTYHKTYLDAPSITVQFYEEVNGTAIPVTVDNCAAIGNDLPTPDPKPNYYFAGWFIDGDPLYPVTSETVVKATFNAYARWVRSVSNATIDSVMSIVLNDSDIIEFSETDIESVTYSSSDTSVATVDTDGTVHAVGVGSTTITITGSLSGDTRVVNITVTPIIRTVTFTDSKHNTTITREVADNNSLGENMPAAPTDANYVFSGWTIENTMNQFTSATVVTGDVTVVANWKEKVTYGSLTTSPSPFELIIGDAGQITLAETIQTDILEGFTVASSDTNVATVTKNDNVITVNAVGYGTANITITGSLSTETRVVSVSVDYLKHKVTFKNGDTIVDEIYVIDNTAIGANMPAAPTKTNYLFDGWFVGDDRLEPVTSETVVEGAIVAVACWTPTIQLATIPSTLIVTIGSTNTVPVTNIPVGMESYTFISSDTNVATVNSTTGVVSGVALGTANITVKGTRSNETKVVAVTVSELTYTVTFMDDDNPTPIDTVSVPVGNTVGQNMPADLTKPNHIFKGWIISGELTPFTSSTQVNDNITVIANWRLELNSATITTTPEPLAFKKGKTGQIALIDATNGRVVEECTYASSNTNIAEISNTNNVATIMGADVGEVTITITGSDSGQVRTVPVTIHNLNNIVFDPDNGNANDITTIQVTDGELIGASLPTNPTKTNATFDWWYLYDEANETLTTIPLDTTQVVTSDKVYKARWAEANDVAAIGTNYYPSIAHAIEAVNAGIPAEIRILQNIGDITCKTGDGVTSSSCSTTGRTTVPANKDITIAGGNFTVECGSSTASNVLLVQDNGILRIKSGTFLCSKKTNIAVLENTGAGKIYITGGTVRDENNRAAIYNVGELYISGGTISTGSTVTERPVIQNTKSTSKIVMSGGMVIQEATTLSGTDKGRGAIFVSSGSATITGGTVRSYSTNTSAIYSEGTVVIGIDDTNNAYDATSPVIQGEEYGISSKEGKTYAIYDGIIKGKTDAVDSTSKITKIEKNAEIVLDTEDGYKVLYYEVPQLKFRIDFNANGGTVSPDYLEYNVNTTIDGSNFPTPTRNNYVFDGWYTDSNLQTQFSAITPAAVGTTTLYAKWTFNSSFTPVTYNILSDAMQDYFTSVSSWVAADATDPSNDPPHEASQSNNYDNGHHLFKESIASVFTDNNCSSCQADNSCSSPEQNKTYCDQPNGYDTGLTDNLNVYLYENDTKGNLVTYTTSTDGKIYNMIPGKTYLWESSTDNTKYGVVTATGNRRTLKTSIRNLRDLGGLTVSNSTKSGTIDYGRLYRGAYISSAQGVTDLTKLGITREIDLRKNGDGIQTYKMNNYDTGTSSNYTDIVVTNYLINPIATPYIATPYLDNYRQIKSTLRTIMEKVVFEHDNIFFHCTIGTDRTGTIAYFLEGLLGVSEEDRLRDYELTYFFGLTNRTRFHDSVSWSNTNPRFYSMYRSYPTNADIYNYYKYEEHVVDQNNPNDLTDDELLSRFRDELIH